MPQRLVFVRHGESEHHVRGLTGGWTDTPLTERGRHQVTLAAHALAGMNLPAAPPVFTSDLERARETAAIIAGVLGSAVTLVPALREINLGEATGMTLPEALRIALPEPDYRDVNWRSHPGSESWLELWHRADTALSEIAAAAPEMAVVVGHGLCGQAVIGQWLGLPLGHELAFRLGPASITDLCVNEWGEREISRLNHVVGEPD